MEIVKQQDSICLAKMEIDVGNIGHITNCYVIYDKKDMSGILFDPADKADQIVKQLDEKHTLLKAIFITHCHSDHICGLEDICNIYKARGLDLKVYIHKNDKNGLLDDDKNYASMLRLKAIDIENIDIIDVEDESIIKYGNIEIEVIHTPGHTDGCVIFVVPILNAMITGDTIFLDCYGRVDLKSGSIEDMKKSIEKIFNRFDDIRIYPGHGKEAVLSDIKRNIRLMLKRYYTKNNIVV